MVDEIIIGEYTDFTDGIQVAEVTGQAVTLACGRLGNRPPYREPGEAEALGFEDMMEARRLAIAASGVQALAQRVGEMDRGVRSLIISKSGALAVQYTKRDGLRELQEVVESLDGGNASLFLGTHAMNVG